jgi:hypothetical protein
VDAGKTGFQLDEFWQVVHDLRDEIRKELFLEAPAAQAFPEAPGEAPREDRADDEQIGLILRQIKSKWAQAQPVKSLDEKSKSAAKPLQPQTASVLEDGEATVIMTPAKPSVQEEAKDEYSQTVVLAAQPQQQGTAPGQDEDFSTETIIMRHPDASAVAPVSAKEPVDLDKTVVLNPSPAKVPPKAKEGPLKMPAEQELEETLIMGAPARSAPAAAQKKPVSADDALEETVILKPEKK